MHSMDAVKAAAREAGMPLTHIGRAIGKRDNYVAVYINKRRDPSGATLAAMLAPCGYTLAAVPNDDVPMSALVIG